MTSQFKTKTKSNKANRLAGAVDLNDPNSSRFGHSISMRATADEERINAEFHKKHKEAYMSVYLTIEEISLPTQSFTASGFINLFFKTNQAQLSQVNDLNVKSIPLDPYNMFDNCFSTTLLEEPAVVAISYDGTYLFLSLCFLLCIFFNFFFVFFFKFHVFFYFTKNILKKCKSFFFVFVSVFCTMKKWILTNKKIQTLKIK